MAYRIRKGTVIDTETGYIVARDYNGSVVRCEAYEVTDAGDLAPAGERSYTPWEIGDLMRDVDGKNHKVIWWEK